MKGCRVGVLALAALVALACAPVASAQVFTGRIEVTVLDSTGAVLPGVTVEVTGPRNIAAQTGPDGAARFLNLEPGTYRVKAALQGFQEYSNNDVPVSAGGSVPLKVTLKMAGVTEQVEVTGETPVIDTKKSGTSTAVTLDELQNIPSARDPWVVMQTVPGIIMDRVNVGGSESGQQSGYQAKGAASADSTWNMDGIPITDMAATGSTPTYYDFDMFQEMNVTTGGADMSSSTGGVHLNFILKSGGNTPHGSARGYFENDKMQGSNMSEELARNLGSPNGKGNRTKRYEDYGFELGGPILKDRLWAWGSLGRTDVRILTIKQTPDRTQLTNRAFKAQGQLTKNIRAGFTYFFGNKQKWGRGASATKDPETTVDQKGPSSFYKGEVNFVVGNNLFLTARVSAFPNMFTFDPQGGMQAQAWTDDAGVEHGSTWNYYSDRPQQTVMGEGSYFKGRHEVKFGFSWRRVTVDSTSALSGNKIYTYHNGYPDMLAYAYSDWASRARAFYTAGWIGDTITMNRMTINAGVRVDLQNDGTLDTSEPAVAGFEKWMPAITAKAMPKVFVYNSVSPRVSVSYAVDNAHKTLLRGSYAMFSSQLGNGSSSFLSVVTYRDIGFPAVDKNGNKIADLNEIDFSTIDSWSGFDITNPGKLDQSVNRVGDYSVPRTHEVIVGLDHELFKDFGVSAAFTWRKLVNFNWTPTIGVRSSMYKQAGTLTGSGLPNGGSFSVPYYYIPESAVPEGGLSGGSEWVKREGYHQRFLGLEVTATKRLSNRWMARLGFSSNQHEEFFDNPATSMGDPTPGPNGPNQNGGLVIIEQTTSGKAGIYQILPKYQLSANGLYQAPAGIQLGMNMIMRQGFGQPWFRSRVPTPDDYFSGSKSILVNTDVGQNRLPSITTMDLRVGWDPLKVFKMRRVGVNIDLDVFNLFNTGAVLKRTYDMRLTGPTGFNQITEIINPRIARIGVRMNF